MKINKRVDLITNDLLDVRFMSEMLNGEFDNVYIILSTLEDEPTDAWEDQGESFLLINIPKEKVMDATIDYKDEILKNLPKLSWLEAEVLRSYVQKRWN